MEQSVADPINPIPLPGQPGYNPALRGLHTRITPERSREMVNRRAKIKAERVQAEQERIEQARQSPAQLPDNYVSASLTRARTQLDRLYEKINDPELSAAEMDKLASAIAKFSEIERNLAMRPAAGTAKIEPKQTQSRASWLLGEPESAPVQSAQPGKSEQE